MRRTFLSTLPPLLFLMLVSLAGCITITNTIPASPTPTVASAQTVPMQTASATAGAQTCCAAHNGHCPMTNGGYPMYYPEPSSDGNYRPIYYPWPWYFPQERDAQYVIIDERGNERSTSTGTSSGTTSRNSDPILGGTSGTRTTSQVRRPQPKSDSASSMFGGSRKRDPNRTVSAPSTGDAVVVSQPNRNTSVDAPGGQMDARPRGDVNRETRAGRGDVVAAPSEGREIKRATSATSGEVVVANPSPRAAEGREADAIPGRRDINREVEARTGGQVRTRSSGDVKRETTAPNERAVVVPPATRPSRAETGASSSGKAIAAPRERDLARPAGKSATKPVIDAPTNTAAEPSAPADDVTSIDRSPGVDAAEPDRAEQ